MRSLSLRSVILLTVVCLTTPSTAAAHSADLRKPYSFCGKHKQSPDERAVRAVLFYSPSCPHCHYVITEVLVPMVNEHGDQLQIVGIDTSQVAGARLCQAAIESYQIPSERQGVPTLIVGDVWSSLSFVSSVPGVSVLQQSPRSCCCWLWFLAQAACPWRER